MTDRDEFMKVVNRNNAKMYEIAASMGMAAQTLYNKLGNNTNFTAPEMLKFRELFPDVTDDEFNKIFFAVELTAHANE
jgi:hypothetical protein